MSFYAVTGTRSPGRDAEKIIRATFAGFADVEGIATGGAYGVDTIAARVAAEMFPDAQRMLLYPIGQPYNAAVERWCTASRGIDGGYLKRDDALVAYGVDGLLAFPLTAIEVQRSGTWATVRRARKAGIPLIAIQPVGN